MRWRVEKGDVLGWTPSYYQWLRHSIYYSLLFENDFHRRMRVVWLFQNRGIDSTDAYINTIINNQEDSHSTHFYTSMFNTGAMVITDDTHSHLSNSFKCVFFTLIGGNCIYNSKFSIFPYFRGSINYCIMKTKYELWLSFSITIWWTI